MMRQFHMKFNIFITELCNKKYHMLMHILSYNKNQNCKKLVFKCLVYIQKSFNLYDNNVCIKKVFYEIIILNMSR